MNCRLFFSTGQLNFVALGNTLSLIKNESREYLIRRFYNFCLLGHPRETYLRSQGRCLRISHCLKNIEDKAQSDSKSSTKSNRGEKVLIITENGKETAMYLNEAQKYAKKYNLSLVKLEKTGGKKDVYKLDKATDVIFKQSKNNNNKKFILKDVIEDHDLETKINSMIKFLEKKVTIVCVVESVHTQNRLQEISSKLKNSKLKDYFCSETQSPKRIIFTLRKNTSNEVEKKKTQDMKKEELA